MYTNLLLSEKYKRINQRVGISIDTNARVSIAKERKRYSKRLKKKKIKQQETTN